VNLMRRDEQRRIRRRTTLLVLYRSLSDIAAKSVMFVITVAAARRLSRDEFGLFALASTLGWLAAVAGDFGIQVHLARAVSQQPAASAGLLRRWLPVRLASGTVALAVALSAIAMIDLGPRAMVPVTLFALAYAATGVCECLYYFFRGHGRTDLESSLTLLHRVSLAILALAVLWRQPRLDLLAVAMLTSSLVTLLVASALASRLALAQGVTLPDAAPLGREFIGSVAPIGVGVLLSALYFRLDVFLIERWSGTAVVALYNAVFRLIDALRLFPAAATAVALPALCRANDARVLMRLAVPLFGSAAAIALILWSIAPWLVPALYGEGYRDSVPLFRILLLALPLMFLNYALTHQLIGWHRHHAYAAICGAALACNVALNIVLIPRLGAAGAAWATLWTELVLTAGCLWALVHAAARVGTVDARRTGITMGAAR
jgi:O-antigen/teichoic acid export membrane protein